MILKDENGDNVGSINKIMLRSSFVEKEGFWTSASHIL
jgi:hypothetical protein